MTILTLLPNGRQQFVDGNGAPLVGGTVATYVPSTLTPKTTWSDIGGTSANTNPITLDALGSAAIWGVGTYRQIVKNSAGTVIWDQVTVAPQLGAGSGALFLDSVTVAVVSTIAGGTTYIYVGGYYTPGDGGAALYKLSTGPTGPGKFQSADGAWWKLAEDQIFAEMFGAKGDGATDDYNALYAASHFSSQTPYLIAGKTYCFNTALSTPVGFICLDGIATLKAVGLGGGSDCWTCGNFPNSIIISGIHLDCNNVGASGFVHTGSVFSDIDIQVLNSNLDGIRYVVSGSNFIQQMKHTSRVQSAGRHGIVLETQGASGAFINECQWLNCQVAGVSQKTAGGVPVLANSAGTNPGSQISSQTGQLTINFQYDGVHTPGNACVFFATPGVGGSGYFLWNLEGGWENTNNVPMPTAYLALAGTTGITSGMSFSVQAGADVTGTTSNMDPVSIVTSAANCDRLRIAAAFDGPSRLVNANGSNPASTYLHWGRYETAAVGGSSAIQALFLKKTLPTDQNDGAAVGMGRQYIADLATNTANQTYTIPQVVRSARSGYTDSDKRILKVILVNQQYNGSGHQFFREYTIFIPTNGTVIPLQVADSSDANMITAITFAISGENLVLTVTTGIDWGTGGGSGALNAVVLGAGFSAT